MQPKVMEVLLKTEPRAAGMDSDGRQLRRYIALAQRTWPDFTWKYLQGLAMETMRASVTG